MKIKGTWWNEEEMGRLSAYGISDLLHSDKPGLHIPIWWKEYINWQPGLSSSPMVLDPT